MKESLEFYNHYVANSDYIIGFQFSFIFLYIYIYIYNRWILLGGIFGVDRV